VIDSGEFEKPEGHANPGSKPYEDKEWVADTVKLGAFKLSPGLLEQMDDYEDLSVGDAELAQLSPEVRGRFTASDGMLWTGNQSSPDVGDIRVRFSIVRDGPVTVVATQIGNTFSPYVSKVGGKIEMLQEGTHSAQSMFEIARTRSRILTWALRLAGLVLMAVGLGMILNVLSVLADVLPFVGDLVGVGTGIFSILVSLILSLATIAVAWLYFRPLIGIGLLALGLAILVGLVMLVRGRRRKRAMA
jgi:hypothetical protein